MRLPAALALVATLTTASASAQNRAVRAVLTQGEVLPSGAEVTSITDVAVSDQGNWLVHVQANQGERVVVDGAEVVAVGDVVDGEVVTDIVSARLDRDGSLVLLYGVAGSGPGAIRTRIRIGGDTVLRQGDFLNVPGLGQQALGRLLDVDVDGGEVGVSCFLAQGSANVPAILLGTMSGPVLDLREAIVRPDAIPGLSFPFETADNDLDVTPTRLWSAAIQIDTGPGAVPAFVRNGVGFGEFTGPTPTGGATWDFGSFRTSIGISGVTARSGPVVDSTGAQLGAIYRETQIVALEGQSIGGVPGDTVASFVSTEVEVLDSEEVVFALRFTSGKDRLMIDDDVILETDVSTTQQGAVVTRLFAGIDRTLDASSDGRLVAILGRLDGQFPTVALVAEREVGRVIGCGGTSNSSGLPGRLEAVGSALLQFDDLAMRATQLPPNQFGLLVVGTTISVTPNPGGSAGNLCIGGGLGRYNALIQPSGPAGIIEVPIDPTAIPQPSSTVAATPGSRFLFQLWHRDVVGGVQTSNFTNAVSVRFL